MTIMKTALAFGFIIFFFLPSEGWTRSSLVNARIYNRSQRDVAFEIYDQVGQCVTGQLKIKQEYKITMGDQSSRCKSQLYYRFQLKALNKNTDRYLEGECVVLPKSRDQDLLILWDGTRCWVKDDF